MVVRLLEMVVNAGGEGRCEGVDELVTGVAISCQYDVGSNGVPPGKRASYTGGKGGFNKRCYLPR